DEQAKDKDPFAGWNVILIEKNPNIPREGKGKTVGGRKQIEANQTPEQYLKLLQTAKQYANEQGLTLEDWLTQFLVYLEKTNQVIDDYAGKGSACYLLASFNKIARALGCGYWCQYKNQAGLRGSNPEHQFDPIGCRAAVGVGKVDKVPMGSLRGLIS
ncbi:MAG: hypothetical protein V1928_03570, partial [Parcubacteria group bacterium]